MGEDSWHVVGHDRSAAYKIMSPQHYVSKEKSINNEGKMSFILLTKDSDKPI